MNSLIIKTINNVFFALFVIVLSIRGCLAAESPIHFERLSIKDGLPHYSVRSILQDSQGFIWVGTLGGLARYDGYSFKVFKHNPKVPTSISDNNIRVIIEDNKGYLWVGTENGLNRFNPQTEVFQNFHHNNDPNSLSDDGVLAITEDSQGNLWIGTKRGLNLFDFENETFKSYYNDSNIINSLSDDYVRVVFEDSQGDFWIGTNDGLNRFNYTMGTFQPYHHNPNDSLSIDHDVVMAIIEDSQGRLWIGTKRGGLNLFNYINETFKHYHHDANDSNSLSYDSIYSITEDRQGNIWIGTIGGLNLFIPQNDIFHHYRYDAKMSDSISSNIVYTVMEDRQGNFWVGTPKGLNHFTLPTENFYNYQHDDNDFNSLSSDVISAIAESNKNKFWVGTNKGLNLFNPKTEEFQRYQHDANDYNSLSSNNIKAIIEDRQGNVWIGTSDGLNLFDPKTNTFQRYYNDAKDFNSLSNNYVRAITEDRYGNIWIGTSGGLNLFKPDSNNFLHYRYSLDDRNSLSDDNIYALIEDSQGNLWLGTKRGLNLFNPETETFQHYLHDDNDLNSLSGNKVTSIKEDHQGNIWIGTSRGLNLLDRESNSFKRFDITNGLPSNIILSIEEDNEGRLWISSTHGLSRFNPESVSFTNYDMSNGLLNTMYNHGASFKSSSGELFFGGWYGLTHFSTNIIIDDKVKPIVVFTDFFIGNQSVPTVTNNSVLIDNLSNEDIFTIPNAIHSTNAITLNHQQNMVTFEFSTLHFTNPKKHQYAYRLEGWDKQWIATDYRNRRATYTNLPAGNYILRVKASNANGVWNEQGASLNLIIKPPPWKTWWAYAIYGLIFLWSVWLFIRIQRNKVLFERNLNKQLENKVIERTIDLQKSNEKLEEISITDQLTGLKNRRFLDNNLKNDVDLVLRKYYDCNLDKTLNMINESDLIFFLIDLDHFKEVNDIHGHTAGDAVLVQIKYILEQVFRETDYLVRWGGEEFLVIARFTERSNAPELAERLRKTVENYEFSIGENNILKKTCSIGFACYPFSTQDTEALTWNQVVDVADHCMYAAKKSSRNAWVGLYNNTNVRGNDLFKAVIEKTETLLQTDELEILTSITEVDQVNWLGDELIPAQASN